jgi:pimeloyl-ACP methyl ester carboxylesterase
MLSTDTLKNPKQALLHNVAQDVATVMNHVIRPRHTKVIGYGYCYGGWIFSLFQASKKNNRLFDYLILDSLPSSLDLLLNNLLKDHRLMGPRTQEEQSVFEHITRFPLLRKPLTYVATHAFTNFSITPDLGNIHIPVLFIHGKKDRVASLSHFHTNFAACSSPEKYALLTPHEHVENFRKSPAICTSVSLKLIEGTLLDSLI